MDISLLLLFLILISIFESRLITSIRNQNFEFAKKIGFEQKLYLPSTEAWHKMAIKRIRYTLLVMFPKLLLKQFPNLKTLILISSLKYWLMALIGIAILSGRLTKITLNLNLIKRLFSSLS
ncbi:hypothetical protein GCM10023213_12560 [Prosthecobacter algae]|uniref:Uncharacterized protein n=1 Tax=Prosthecobacter algae TaxID=1144682 RepID=A0ABP9P1G0_9BACT